MSEEAGYCVTATWEGGRKGVVSAAGIDPAIRFSAPPEFKGEGGLWTPEHFFVAAIATCYILTFYAIAEMSKLEFLWFQLHVEGKLGKPDGKLRFTEIVLRPGLVIISKADRERASRLLEKAEQSCLIARSLNCPVTIEPLVQHALETPDAPSEVCSVPVHSA